MSGYGEEQGVVRATSVKRKRAEASHSEKKAFEDAVRNDDFDSVFRILQTVDVDEPLGSASAPSSALCIAAGGGNLAMMDYLISKGADANFKCMRRGDSIGQSGYWFTPLWVARNDAKASVVLLGQGGNPLRVNSRTAFFEMQSKRPTNILSQSVAAKGMHPAPEYYYRAFGQRERPWEVQDLPEMELEQDILEQRGQDVFEDMVERGYVGRGSNIRAVMADTRKNITERVANVDVEQMLNL